MNVSFRQPLLLLLAIPLLAALLVPFFIAVKRGRVRGRQKASLAIRVIALTLALLALSGFTAGRRADTDAVIIIADLSDSTRGVRERIAEAVAMASEYSGRSTKIGLVTFGHNSYYEIPVTDRFVFSRFETSPDGGYTDIYSALIKAAAMFPGDSSKRIVLLTDGKENVGAYKEAATVLLQRGIRLDARVYETGADDIELQVTDLSMPETVYKGEAYNITVTAESTYEGKAELTLYADGTPVSSREVTLTRGVNRFVFRETALASGIATYSAEITAESDSLRKNNKVYSFIKILGTPRVLVIDGTGTESHEITALLGEGVECDVRYPETVPTDIAGLRSYNAVVMMNVSKESLPDGYDELLEVYVRKLGRGLITTGGDKTYALGGWEGSTLEKILPVNMITTDKAKLRDLAMMILIDNSGSMGAGAGSSLELAKQGAINAAGIIKSIDSVGVIAFSDNAVWVSKLTPGTEKERVQGKIASIGSGGGTMIAGALSAAYQALLDSGKSLKSVLLLTDGQPADGEAVFMNSLDKKLAEAGITVNSIAVGEYADTAILASLAKATGGRVSTALKAEELPEIIFTEAVKILHSGYINNVTFTPEVGDWSSVLSEVRYLPELDGFILTEGKDLASKVLKTPEGDPILSVWQYGLGRAASLMTDLNGKWSSKLLASGDGRTLIGNIVSYVLPSDEEGEGSVTVRRVGDKGVVTASSPVTDRTLPTEAVIISPSGKESVLTLVQTGIGEYSGEFELEEEGSYVTVVTQKDGEDTVMNKEGALAVRYSDEYDAFRTYDGSLEALCAETGGKASWTKAEELFTIKTNPVTHSLEFTVPFIIAMLVLVMADIAVRRLDIGGMLAAAAAKRRSRRPAKNPEEEPVTAAETGRAVKEKKERKPGKTSDGDAPPGAAKTKKKKESPEKEKETPPAETGKSSVSSLLKEKQNMSRKKM
ncbi:MAG: VWA domain-containing protein [Clostridia bacterium]|nr:VWA domain-containing protein [Clostridia bacterium]